MRTRPSRRVEHALDAKFYGRGIDFPRGYAKRIGAVKPADVVGAFQDRIDATSVSIVAVGDAAVLAPRFEAMDGIDSVSVVPVE